MEVGTWNVVAKSFTRFFDYQEVASCPAANEAWRAISSKSPSELLCGEKADGSLIMMFAREAAPSYFASALSAPKVEWTIVTRNSWADGKMMIDDDEAVDGD